ncbi:MAG: acyltransferase family protein [Prevotella sp.]|jgi:hypothetical protein|nr:acyltransferase family protein [Prevotella sp.]
MRRYDIDNLRVIAFALLIFYHVGMFFVPWDFHIKNSIIYEGITFPMLFLNQWRLSLLFIISGMGTYYALMKRNSTQFAIERLKRLFIPFILGMIFIVPPQVYFERLDKGQFSGSYFDYWPKEAFAGIYPEGNISWHHLWFILYLLIFSLILIPAFIYIKKNPDMWMLRKLKMIISKAFGLYIFIIPLFLWGMLLAPHFPQTNGLINDWYNLVNYCTLFFFGYLLISLKDVFWDAVTKNRHIFLICGIIGFPLLMSLWYLIESFPLKDEIQTFVKMFNSWSWILTLIGYAAVYLNKPSKTLTYANEAVYPFYILHQTIIIALGYYLKDADMGFCPKFSIMVTGTFGISWFIYEFGIRRYSIIRPLFGMKPKANNR